MRSTVLIIMIAAAYAYYQVFAEDVYIAELMVESNVTLEAQTILTILNGVSDLVVTDTDGASYTVTLTNNTLVAECLIIGEETSCNCSSGYIWSNEVCYNFNCCRETTCKKNVSMVTPLCVAKVQVRINGSIHGSIWSDANIKTVKDSFETLNGLESVIVTAQSSPDLLATFETNVSAKLNTSKLQTLVTKLEESLSARVVVDTLGMVNIDIPNYPVCYKSSPVLKCTFEEASGSSGWNMSKPGQRFELNNGFVVEVDHSCATADYLSCVAVTLRELTGVWEGTYECGFTSGSIRHTANDFLKVALLPDEIIMEIDPLVADCTEGPETTVKVSATILTTKQNYEFWWTPKEVTIQNNSTNTNADVTVYIADVVVPCDSDVDKYVNITFKNERSQKKTATVKIPILKDNEKFCLDEVVDGQPWPKTPSGETVTNRTCSAGRVGYRSRSCEDGVWQDVFSECINKELNKVKTAAQDFLNGLGATQEVALNIFDGLKNNSGLSSGSGDSSGDSTADISASINVLNTMATATKNITVNEEVFPSFVAAASNMLNSNWSGVNDSIRHNMSAKYIQSVEDLVKNIEINVSRGLQSPNLDLKFCTTADCNVNVFNVSVNLNKTSGIMKTVAVKNLMKKLPNNFKSDRNPLLLSTTLENSTDSSIVIKMEFPNDNLQNDQEPFCVFWDPESHIWSKDGCSLNKTEGGNHTVCVCNHLTSFSVLMSKTDVSNPDLDIITYVGLGVSICSLLIFLIIEAVVWSAVAKSNLSHFRHTSVVNIAMFRLLADCSFLASIYPEKLSDSMCLAFTVCKHLFYLAMFCWMLCLSIMLVHQLIFVFSPLRKRVFMFLSSIVGYVSPMIIVGSSYVYCKYTERDYYVKGKCWLVYKGILDGSLHAFLLPAGAIILTNLFSMVVVIVTLTKSSVSDSSKSDDKDTAKSILKVVVFLTPLFGITWSIGYFVFSLEHTHVVFPFVNYTFTILNSFQGLFIFLTGCVAEQKVREELMRLIMGKSKGNTDSTKNLTSTTYTKDR